MTSLIADFDVVLADLDGVVYEGTAAIRDAVASVSRLQLTHRLGFVTNNSSRKPETIVEQLSGFGVIAKPDDVVSSGQSGVELLATLVPSGSKVLVVGGDGLRFYVAEAGFEAPLRFHQAGMIHGWCARRR